MVQTCKENADGEMANDYAGTEAKRDNGARTTFAMKITYRLRTDRKGH